MNSLQKAFSIVEVLIVVAVVGVIAAIAVIGVSDVVQSARDQRLTNGIETVNRAVMAFQASGGNLGGTNDPSEILTLLKKRTILEDRTPGLSGAKIDPRLVLELVSPGEKSPGTTYAYWDAGAERFVLKKGVRNVPGINAFVLNADAGEIDYGTTEANVSFAYAEKDQWIWDYEEVVAAPPAGPSDFDVTPVPGDNPPPAVVPGGPSSLPPPGGTTPLNPPTFSIPGGNYPATSFDLAVSLADPNPAGAATIYYSVDYGNWTVFSGPITTSPGTIIAAQAIANTDAYTNSGRVDQDYQAIPQNLLPPIIVTSVDTLGLFTNRTSTITLTDPNIAGVSTLEYRIAGGPWQTYTGPFTISRNDYPNGSLVQARAVPADPWYIASTTTLRSVGAEEPLITGLAHGSFSDPVGGQNMVTNLGSNASSNYFEWGSITSGSSGNSGSGLSKSTLTYNTTTISSITTGQRFQIGSLSYYNGEIYSGTGADSVSFAIDLDFDINGVTADSLIDFDFELINTKNNNSDVWADADYVRLANPIASQTVTFNGVEFLFQLEFGETTSNGISYFDEFHVQEQKNATTKVYGTLVEIGSFLDPVTDTLDGTTGIIGGITGTVTGVVGGLILNDGGN